MAKNDISQLAARPAGKPAQKPPRKERRSRPPGRPPKAGAAEEGTRELLVNAALRLFARKGFDGASLAQIADAAGATPSLVHYYFDSKTDLWETAFDTVFAELREEFGSLEEELQELDTLAALESVIRRFIAFSTRHPEVSLILNREDGEAGPRMEWLTNQHLVPLRQLPLKLIVAAQEEGRLRTAPPEHILQILIGACLRSLRGRPSIEEMYGLPAGSREASRIHSDLVVATVLHGLVVEPTER